MTLLIQQILAGLSAGSIYGALALALVLIYRSTRVVNFAQGQIGTFAAFVCWQLNNWGVPLFLALVLTAALSFVLGVAIYGTVVRPLLRRPAESITIACIGMFIGFQALCLWIWGSQAFQFPRIFPAEIWVLGDIRISATDAGTLGTLVVLCIGLTVLFRFTRAGLVMRAAAAEPDKSLLVGVDVNRTLAWGWGLATVFGFVAAVLAAPTLFLGSSMMYSVTLYGLAAATLGGWDSPVGAVVGGLLVGLSEALVTTYVPAIGAELRLAIPFVLIAAVLLVRRQGLFGSVESTRV